MELILTRIAKRRAYTIGRLSIVERIDDAYLAGEKETYFCDTLEPPVMEMKTSLPKEDVLRSPMKAEVLKPFAIPEGRYPVVITWSPKFKMWLPLLLGVPLRWWAECSNRGSGFMNSNRRSSKPKIKVSPCGSPLLYSRIDVSLIRSSTSGTLRCCVC